MKKLLLIGDMVGYGKIALSVMIPILSNMKVSVSNLPTALVSNSFDYGKFSMIDLSDYVEKSVEIWKDLNIQFDSIITGFITSKKQVDSVKNILDFQIAKPLIICDPILGDYGKLYKGLGNEMIHIMNEMIPLSDIILPNVTEVSLLLNEPYPEKIDDQSIMAWFKKLESVGAKSIVITSVEIDEEYFVYGYDHTAKQTFKVKFKMIPYKFAGTGDLFTAFISGFIANGKTLKQAVEFSVKIISEILGQEKVDKNFPIHNINIEKYIPFLEHI